MCLHAGRCGHRPLRTTQILTENTNHLQNRSHFLRAGNARPYAGLAHFPHVDFSFPRTGVAHFLQKLPLDCLCQHGPMWASAPTQGVWPCIDGHRSLRTAQILGRVQKCKNGCKPAAVLVCADMCVKRRVMPAPAQAIRTTRPSAADAAEGLFYTGICKTHRSVKVEGIVEAAKFMRYVRVTRPMGFLRFAGGTRLARAMRQARFIRPAGFVRCARVPAHSLREKCRFTKRTAFTKHTASAEHTRVARLWGCPSYPKTG